MTTPFGKSMLSRGLAAYDEASLRTALDALEAERKDSDSDGTPDIVELRGAADPNLAAGEDVIVPEYGCAVVAVAASLRLGSLESTAVALAALGVAIVRRSRRPRSRKS